MTEDTCTWQVQVPSNDPEPDSEADCWMIVECGAPVETVRHDLTDETGWSDGWRCEAGHEHLPITISLAPNGPEFQREQAERAGVA